MHVLSTTETAIHVSINKAASSTVIYCFAYKTYHLLHNVLQHFLLGHYIWPIYYFYQLLQRIFYWNDSRITEFYMIDTKTHLLLMW